MKVYGTWCELTAAAQKVVMGVVDSYVLSGVTSVYHVVDGEEVYLQVYLDGQPSVRLPIRRGLLSPLLPAQAMRAFCTVSDDRAYLCPVYGTQREAQEFRASLADVLSPREAEDRSCCCGSGEPWYCCQQRQPYCG